MRSACAYPSARTLDLAKPGPLASPAGIRDRATSLEEALGKVKRTRA